MATSYRRARSSCRDRFRVLRLVGALVPGSAALTAPPLAAESVTIGAQRIELPAPAGFTRVDDGHPAVAEHLRSLGCDRDTLACYLPDERAASLAAGHATGFDRSAWATVAAETRHRRMEPWEFADLVSEFDAAGDPPPQASGRGGPTAVRPAGGDPPPDGRAEAAGRRNVYLRGEDHLCWWTINGGQLQAAGDNSHTPGQRFLASCMLYVGGKVIELQCSAPPDSESDIQGAKKTLDSWRTAVAAANASAGDPAGIVPSPLSFALIAGFTVIVLWAGIRVAAPRPRR